MTTDETIEHMARFIATRRGELRLTLEEVASRAGVTKSHIWELEKGRARNPSIRMALALCDALQCSLNSLLGFDVSSPQFSDEEIALISAHRAIFGKR